MQKFFYAIIIIGCAFPLINLIVINKNNDNVTMEVKNETKAVSENNLALNMTPDIPVAKVKEEKKEVKEVKEVKVQTIKEVKESTPEADIVYDGLTLDELALKLDKSLKSTLSGKGSLYASYALQMGVDPYVAVAITLHETGCSYNCSKIVRECNNVGGMKGSPGCNGGSYKKFSTIDEGIKSFIDNLSNNYYKKGLNTVEKINTKYATSTVWSSKINNYISKIRAS